MAANEQTMTKPGLTCRSMRWFTALVLIAGVSGTAMADHREHADEHYAGAHGEYCRDHERAQHRQHRRAHRRAHRHAHRDKQWHGHRRHQRHEVEMHVYHHEERSVPVEHYEPSRPRHEPRTYDHRPPNAGGLVGAAVGGLLGSQIGNGDGRLAATAAGTLAGFLFGNDL